jgi:hypothetical protein
MYIGMLWFDNDSKTELNAKVARAADYYHRKYGKTPNMCYVHPSMLTRNAEAVDAAIRAGSVEVRSLSTVLPNHFWIGITANER